MQSFKTSQSERKKTLPSSPRPPGEVSSEHMREHPWHTRRPTAEHFERFKNVIDAHGITTGWLSDLAPEQSKQSETESHVLRRAMAPGIHQKMKTLEEFTQRTVTGGLEGLLDESYPDEVLERMENAVWTVQAWLLKSVLEKTEKSERPATRNLLEQSSWKSGRSCALKRWPQFPKKAKEDLRGICNALQGSPMKGFLIRRATAWDLQLELMACPHSNLRTEVKEMAHELCSLHAHWMRGFIYAFNTTIVLTHEMRPKNAEKNGDPLKRCKIQCQFHQRDEHPSIFIPASVEGLDH